MPKSNKKVLARRYEIEEELGEGATASVYKAWDHERGCVVAVKVMKAGQGDPIGKRRFRDEADSLGELDDHPHIVRIYELVEDSEYGLFIVMDYVDGQSLRELMADRNREPLSVVEATYIAHQVGAALNYTHKKGIYHRDVKPGNILLDEKDEAHLADFGLALLTERTRHTVSGKFVGTLAYAAPEQLGNEGIDVRTDVYGLGALLYELLTGRPPFIAPYYQSLTYDIREVVPDAPSQHNPQIPPRVDEVILKALEKDKSNRYSNVAEMINELLLAVKDEALDPSQGTGLFSDVNILDLQPLTPPPPPLPQEPKAKPRGQKLWILAVGTSIVLLAVVGFWIASGWSCPPWICKTETPTSQVAIVSGTLSPSPISTATYTATPVPPTATLTPTPTLVPIATQVPTASPTPTETAFPTWTPTPSVGVENVDIYTCPSKLCDIIAHVKEGRLAVLCSIENGKWLQVNYLGWTGWISAEWIDLEGTLAVCSTIPPTPTCETPHIKTVHPSSNTVDTMSTITITCELTSSINRGLTHTWASSGGVISGTGDIVTYWSDEIGTQMITVTVRHKRCGQDEKSIQIQAVEAKPPPGLFEPDPDTAWGRVWHGDVKVRRKLRWATEEEMITFGAQQRFQHGMMFWWDDKKGEIYVMTDDGQWQVYVGNWQEGMNEYTCPDVAGSRTPPTPRRGFGEIWCLELGGPDAAIGWAEQDEQGYYIHYRRFEHGLMWADIDGRIYIRYDDNTWEKPLDTSLLQIIDDFEVYVGDSALNEVYGIHDGWVNAGVLTLASPPDVFNGIRGAAFHYQIKSDQSDFAGFERTFAPQDWRGYSGLRVWVKGEGSGDLVIQFREAGGEVWKYRTSLSNLSVKDLWIPFDENALECDCRPGGSSPRENGRIDLDAIDCYGIFVGNGGVGSGTIYVDNIRLII